MVKPRFGKGRRGGGQMVTLVIERFLFDPRTAPKCVYMFVNISRYNSKRVINLCTKSDDRQISSGFTLRSLLFSVSRHDRHRFYMLASLHILTHTVTNTSKTLPFASVALAQVITRNNVTHRYTSRHVWAQFKHYPWIKSVFLMHENIKHFTGVENIY